jgi:hypothetical protein
MCEIPTSVTGSQGVYLAELAIIDNTETPFYSNEVYVYVGNSAWGAKFSQMPTLDEVRLSLRDNDPQENELIENYDFGLPELCYAITRTIKFWNAQPPLIAATNTTGGLDPEVWLTGTHLYLFELAEEHYRRNRLPYQAGQTNLDDKARSEEYNKAYQDRAERFRKMVIHRKVAMNMARGWSAFGGRYGY